MALSTLLVVGLAGAVKAALDSHGVAGERDDLARQAAFAMERMTQAVGYSRVLILPLADNPATDWREHVREETVPASAPEGSSTKATAVLAVTLPPDSDLDGNGVADADNDNDGRVDEDLAADVSNDGAAGLVGIDDDGDGLVDEDGTLAGRDDDDEDGAINEDGANGIDDDGDGLVGEDAENDANGDGCPGTCGVDDDGDGAIDEGGVTDDDEDGANSEDWYDAVAFFVRGDALIERIPVPWDQDGSGGVDGRDYVESVLAEHVIRLRVERIPQGVARAQLVDLTLELAGATGVTVSLHTQIRVGGAL